MTTYLNIGDSDLLRLAPQQDATLQDVKRLDELQRIFGDPRKRVDVSQESVATGSDMPNLPASSRFQLNVW